MAAETDPPASRPEVEAEFWKWLAVYKDEQLGGTMVSKFLSAEHLKAAFLAGRKSCDQG